MDQLQLKFTYSVNSVWESISKYKRVRTPAVDYELLVLVNGTRVDDDEVFLPKVFFESLAGDGKYPMFTCTCGIFGCGGFYVNVRMEQDCVRWEAETARESVSLYRFTPQAISKFAEELIAAMEEIEGVFQENGLSRFYAIDEYKEVAAQFSQQHIGE